MGPSGLAIVTLGLAELHHTPPLDWTSYVVEEYHRNRASATPTDTAVFIWALSRFHQTKQAGDKAVATGQVLTGPTKAWLQQYSGLLKVSIAPTCSNQTVFSVPPALCTGWSARPPVVLLPVVALSMVSSAALIMINDCCTAVVV